MSVVPEQTEGYHNALDDFCSVLRGNEIRVHICWRREMNLHEGVHQKLFRVANPCHYLWDLSVSH